MYVLPYPVKEYTGQGKGRQGKDSEKNNTDRHERNGVSTNKDY
jgi:hypothetical protein